jgi:hypothetical protein
MEPVYGRRARRALYTFLICAVVAVPILVGIPAAKVQGTGWAILYLFGAALWLVCIVMYWYGMWVYARAKGYSGWFGLILGVFPPIGVLILVLMKDRNTDIVATSA